MNRKYTAEHIAWLAANISGCPFQELAEKFNKQFGFSISRSAMVSLADRHGLHNGRDTKILPDGSLLGLKTRFQKGLVPWNKGKKGVGGWPPTQFKKGHMPANYRPVGSERVNVDGYVEIKIADPNKWRLKHQIIWEQVHGPIPRGHAIIFGDGNKLNLSPDNLILVSRKQLVRMNQKKLIQNDVELTKTGVVIADILNKIGERKKQKGDK
ncbi:MAG: HNH endonuclease signature motif containing protein [Peptococcaceae bacterium]|jgi:hypothetical protein|nr:HNH endonuclease [Peptococcaceae bacterium]MDH7525260.1 HNH endonuclease signature motif containing protein [Peptococcaceae bacterium]